MTEQEAIEVLSSMDVDGSKTADIKTAVALAIDALGKQIPMERKFEVDITGMRIRVCGSCGDATGSGEFCRWCGQKVRWT